MKRRDSIKALVLSTVSAGLLIDACKPKETASATPNAFSLDRAKEELEREQKLLSETFFNAHEMTTITLLADIIIPADEKSGSASDAKVPAFIEFIVKDMPSHQTPLRGGLRWLDVQCMKRYEKAFKDCSAQQQLEMVDAIAWPEKAKPEMKQGVAFFNLLRNLVATGFYTSEIGVKDLAYNGNTPNQWNGVPDEILKQYGLSYTQKDLDDCISFDA